MNNLIVHASSASQLLTMPRSKKEVLSETAKTMVENTALKHLYDLRPSFESKYTIKGDEMEAEAIELLNREWGSDFVKNTERIKSYRFSGEADIVHGNTVIDIKCSWSAETFPWTEQAALKQVKKGGYEEQVRTYMMLYDLNEAYVSFVLLSTPANLLRKHEIGYHQVDHIPESKRLTSVRFDRDREWEDKANAAWEVANQYYLEFVEQLKMK